MTQQSKFTPGPLRAYERNDDMADWVIRDANNHLVAGGIPKELALLFVKAPEMYELLLQIERAKNNILSIEKSEGAVASSTGCPSPTRLDWEDIVDNACRIKAAIDGEGSE
ncbi:hypothetical protein LCGC14_1871110 [marine sediment metagenome]|uniref:Uncharacterized protein n=1 Tax=marine sediment metagenome TaxID=412755 RepID=A0A0F9J3U0_9ZZZZ